MLVIACENETEINQEIKNKAAEKDRINNYKGNFSNIERDADLKGKKLIYQVKVDSIDNPFKKSF